MADMLTRPIAFIPAKHPDLATIGELLEVSRREGRYANFGPLARRLGDEIAAYLGYDDARKGVACANATIGLTAAAGTLSVAAGHPLRWVSGAHGFFSTFTNVFADAQLVDCDESGCLDMSAIARIDPSSYDGIVFTNVFGLYDDFREIFAFCAEHSKKLILDNAPGFGITTAGTLPASAKNIDWIEIFSFHQTKPFGIGEGGVALMRPDHRPIFEAMINFGVGLPSGFGRYFSNGKMSELAAAAILSRIATTAQWRSGHIEQAERIAELATALGLRLWSIPSRRATPAHLAFLAPHPIDYELLANPTMVLAKYYVPAKGNFPVANRLFAHVINMPTHPDMKALSNTEISNSLESLLHRTRPNV